MASERPPARSRRPFKLLLLALLGVTLVSGFAALGTWQVQRLGWKLDLIARVDARVHAPPVAPPGRAQWSEVSDKHSNYRHVRVTGRYLPQAQTLVHSTTRKGRGYWVMTPLRTPRGFIVYINRGFLAADQAGRPSAKVPPPRGTVTLTGLLGVTEPGGRFLRANVPQAGRWYSRDVIAIAQHAGLATRDVAPYFISADAASVAAPELTGGMTVVHFRNAHLSYAVTWYGLALLVAVGAVIVVRHERRKRHQAA